MKYLCLVYGEENAIQSMNDQHCLDYDSAIRASGHCIASEALQPVATATTVRVRNGKVSVTDGPFAETKDLIAGWMVIDVESYDRVLELAGELSAAPGAGGKPIHEWLEVRPFLTAPPTITE
jgi:hypothetical protein